MYLDSSKLLYEAVNSVLAITVSSPSAEADRMAARSLLEKGVHGDPPQYENLFSIFAAHVVDKLTSCFVKKKSYKREKEIMWGLYHQLRTSGDFCGMWESFMDKDMGVGKPSPIFYQHVSHHIFKALITKNYPIYTADASPSSSRMMSREEESALRYVAGYICRRVRQQLETSTHQYKDDMILCIMELSGDEEDELRGTEDWINSIDRGGLWHVSDSTYGMFHAMEVEVRRHFAEDRASKLTEGSRNTIVKAIMADEDVLFEWCTLAADAEDVYANDLLQRIVELYVTVRGYAYATSCVETYKRLQKQTLQKGKGIRKELFTSKVHDSEN